MNRVEQVTGKGVVREESPKPSKKLSDEFKDLLEKIASKVTLETNRVESSIEVISPIKSSIKAKIPNGVREDNLAKKPEEPHAEQKIQIRNEVNEKVHVVDDLKLSKQTSDNKVETKVIDQKIPHKNEENQPTNPERLQQVVAPHSEHTPIEVALQNNIEISQENIDQVQSFTPTSQAVLVPAEISKEAIIQQKNHIKHAETQEFKGAHLLPESVEITDIPQTLKQLISNDFQDEISEISAKDLEIYFKLKDLKSASKSPLEQALETVTPQNIQAVIRQLSSSSEVMKSIIESAQSSQLNQKNNKEGIHSPSITAISADIKKSGVEREVRQRPLSRAHEARTMEKVESVLKEAVKSKDNKSITLRLDPPALGAMRIDVGLKDGTLHAKLIPESLQVGNFLREHAHELVISLRKLGLHVEKVTVSVVTEQGFESQNQAGSTPFSREEGNKQNTEQKHEMSNEVFSSIQETQELKATDIDHWVA